MSAKREAVLETPAAGATRRLLDLHQAAAYMNVSYWTIRDWILAGELPAMTLPPLRPRDGDRPKRTLRRTLVDVRELDAFIERCKGR